MGQASRRVQTNKSGRRQGGFRIAWLEEWHTACLNPVNLDHPAALSSQHPCLLTSCHQGAWRREAPLPTRKKQHQEPGKRAVLVASREIGTEIQLESREIAKEKSNHFHHPDRRRQLDSNFSAQVESRRNKVSLSGAAAARVCVGASLTEAGAAMAVHIGGLVCLGGLMGRGGLTGLGGGGGEDAAPGSSGGAAHGLNSGPPQSWGSAMVDWAGKDVGTRVGQAQELLVPSSPCQKTVGWGGG